MVRLVYGISARILENECFFNLHQNVSGKTLMEYACTLSLSTESGRSMFVFGSPIPINVYLLLV